MTLSLGIDIGTQSVKALFYDFNSREVVASESQPLELVSRADGSMEQMANWWVEALGCCIERAPLRLRSDVRVMSVSGQQHGFVPLDGHGEVLAPVKLWCDTSTQVECDEIMHAFGGTQRCIDRLGNAILPGYTASKIRWLKNKHPDLYNKLATILLPHDYINFYLTGRRVMEYGDASGTGLLDVRNRSWSEEMLRALDSDRDLSDCLPELLEPDATVGTLLPDVAKQLGLPESVIVATGGGDNMMGAIGTGNVVPGRLTMSLGTSGTLFAYSDQPIIDPEGNIAAFCSSTGGWLPLLCTMNCTSATETLRDLFGLTLDEFEAQITGISPGSDGLVNVPFYNGERSPNLPKGKGCLFGMDTGNTTLGHILRSAVESVTFSLKAGINDLTRLGCEISEIVLTGGGANSASWRQAVADVCNLPVHVLVNQEGAAMGAALQAYSVLSKRPISEITEQHLKRDDSLSCQPNSTVVDKYQHYFQRYLDHVDQVRTLYAD